MCPVVSRKRRGGRCERLKIFDVDAIVDCCQLASSVWGGFQLAPAVVAYGDDGVRAKASTPAFAQRIEPFRVVLREYDDRALHQSTHGAHHQAMVSGAVDVYYVDFVLTNKRS